MPTTTNNGWSYPSSTDLVKDGATNFQTLATGIDTSVGTGLLAWQSYTPSVGSWSIGNGVFDSKYVKIGKTVIWNMKVTSGSTTVYGNPSFTLPVQAAVGNSYMNPAVVGMLVAGSFFQGFVWVSTVSQVNISVSNAASTYLTVSSLSTSVPATWNTGSTINFCIVYQAA
jgi:hypothetical protein